MQNELRDYADIYKRELVENVIPFWMKHSKDESAGGYFTCLGRYGEVFDTDKFVWLQARQVWMFSWFCNHLEKKQEWLDMARHGVEFLKRHGRDDRGNWYFSLDRKGRPLVQPYNFYTDCFAAMGFGEYHLATGDGESRRIALKTYDNILARQDHPKGIYDKQFPGTRPLKTFAQPMILCCLALSLEKLIGHDRVDDLSDRLTHQLLGDFVDKSTGYLLENINPDNTFNDSFEGRLLLPGHAIEAMWFVTDLALRRDDRKTIEKATELALRMLKLGWDDEYGGIFYYLDIKGTSPIQLEWDRKLWWVHIETLVTLAKSYALTGNSDCRDWFRKVHDYTWSHFRDPEYPEWFGYLDRYGKTIFPLKAGKWKGCFHIPRGLFQVWKTLDS